MTDTQRQVLQGQVLDNAEVSEALQQLFVEEANSWVTRLLGSSQRTPFVPEAVIRDGVTAQVWAEAWTIIVDRVKRTG
jgi:hypothetical protein